MEVINYSRISVEAFVRDCRRRTIVLLLLSLEQTIIHNLKSFTMFGFLSAHISLSLFLSLPDCFSYFT